MTDGGRVLIKQTHYKDLTLRQARAAHFTPSHHFMQMSLVGPRPPLPSEVESYDYVAVRRLRLRPGLTGLWQVSGRSDLSWEESLRLDLRYVDNWSMALDLHILFRTWRAVFSGAGAY